MSYIGIRTVESKPADSTSALNSPRRDLLMQAAVNTVQDNMDSIVGENQAVVPSKWKNFAQPVRIMLQTFEDVSDQNEDFWHRAAPFFQRREVPAGTVLYSRGDEPDGFYLLEDGRFRAEYDLEQGHYSEVILPGTTCGELPFFSETDRTGRVVAERDCVAWLLTTKKYKELEDKLPDIATELLKIGLKLTSERMNAITSYVAALSYQRPY
jgi:sulfate permease, SulP family